MQSIHIYKSKLRQYENICPLISLDDMNELTHSRIFPARLGAKLIMPQINFTTWKKN